MRCYFSIRKLYIGKLQRFPISPFKHLEWASPFLEIERQGTKYKHKTAKNGHDFQIISSGLLQNDLCHPAMENTFHRVMPTSWRSEETWLCKTTNLTRGLQPSKQNDQHVQHVGSSQVWRQLEWFLFNLHYLVILFSLKLFKLFQVNVELAVAVVDLASELLLIWLVFIYVLFF